MTTDVSPTRMTTTAAEDARDRSSSDAKSYVLVARVLNPKGLRRRVAGSSFTQSTKNQQSCSQQPSLDQREINLPDGRQGGLAKRTRRIANGRVPSLER